MEVGDFPGDPVAKTVLPMQGAQVQSLTEELRVCMLHGAVKKTENKTRMHTHNTLGKSTHVIL